MFKLYLIRPKFYRSTSNIMCSNVTLSSQLRPNIISLCLAWIYMYITPLSLNITPVSLYNKWIVCLSSAVQEMATSWITAGWVQNRGLTSKHPPFPQLRTTFSNLATGQTSDWLQRELCFLYKESNSLLISSIQTQPLYKPSKLGSYATSQPSSVIGPRLLFNQSLFLFTHMSRTATLNHTFLSPPLTSCSRLCLLLVPCNLKFPTGSLHPTNQARMNPKTQNYFSFQPLPRNSAQAKSKYPSTQQKQTPSHAASIHTSSNNSGKKKKNKKNEKISQRGRRQRNERRQEPRRIYSHQQSPKTIIYPGLERIAGRSAELSPGSQTFFHPSSQPEETSATTGNAHITESPGKDVMWVQRQFF